MLINGYKKSKLKIDIISKELARYNFQIDNL